MRSRLSVLQYTLVAVAVLLGLIHTAAGGFGLLTLPSRHPVLATFPYRLNYRWQVVSVEEDSPTLPIRPGDTLVSVNGAPLNKGWRHFVEIVDAIPPGSTITYQFHTAADPARIQVAHVPSRLPRKRPAWAVALNSITVIIPGLLLCTGLYVVLARPGSWHAWQVLCILSFTGTVLLPTMFMPTPWVYAGALWNSLVQTGLPLAMLFFGLTFPQRGRLDERLPWLKWALAIPPLVLYPLDLATDYLFISNWSILTRFFRVLGRIQTVENVIAFICISIFFFAIASKIRTVTGDARRRLKILYAGASIGLTPFLVLLIVAYARGKSIDTASPRWILVSAVLLLMLFPISLAYVVVVQKAMDLRILIRQGTRYFFARNSIIAIRVLLALLLTAKSMQLLRSHHEPRNVDIVQLIGLVALLLAFQHILSKRLQQKIDQRFFREAYSAEQVLSDLSEDVRNYIEAAPLLHTVSERVGSTLHVKRISIFLRTADGGYRLQESTGTPDLPTSGLTLSAASTTITALARSKAPAIVYQDDAGWLRDATEHERAALQDLSTELLVPLPGRNRLIGVMALGPKLSEEPYSKSDRALLQTLASQTGLALENAELIEHLKNETSQRERMSREMEIAREVQERLFPQVYPEIDRVDMAGFCRPAQAVGGDYFDLFCVSNGTDGGTRLAIAVGDISGKGISASLLMASLRASLRSLSRVQSNAGERDLATLMRTVNDLVYESSAANRYATFFFADFDPVSRCLTYVNAGHNPPVVVRGNQTLRLDATGCVIGLLQGMEFSQQRIQLQPGDVLIAYTDGVSEAMNPEEEEWGEDAMVEVAREMLHSQNCSTTAQSVVECLVREADRFAAGAPQHDDMTVVAVRIL